MYLFIKNILGIIHFSYYFDVYKSPIMKYMMLLGICLFFLFGNTSTAQSMHPHTVYFAKNSHRLGKKTKTLASILQKMNKFPTLRLRIEGYADPIGTTQENQILSAQRTEAVYNYFITHSIEKTRLDTVSYGETRALASNETAEGRAKNRAVRCLLKGDSSLSLVHCKFVDAETGKPLVAELVILEDSRRLDTLHQKQSIDYKADYGSPRWNIYATKTDYFFSSVDLELPIGSWIDTTIALVPMRRGAGVDLNLLFKGGLAVFVSESMGELTRLLSFMEENPHAKIEIIGHVNVPFEDKIPMESASFELSVHRAQAVYEYLKSNGIAQERLKYKGMGNWQMRFPRAQNEAEAQQNRRVEIFMWE